MIETRRGTKGWIAAGLCALLAVACTSPSEAPDQAESQVGSPEAPPPPAPPAAATAPVVTNELFVDVEAEPDEGPPPLTVQFTATVEDNEGPVECEWDFGDGTPKKKGLQTTHVYSAVADYEIVTTCKDSTGIEGDGEVDVFVESDD